MIGQIPAIISPSELKKILNIKSHDTFLKLPIRRCPLFKGSSKFVFLASDVLDYLISQRDSGDIDLDDLDL